MKNLPFKAAIFSTLVFCGCGKSNLSVSSSEYTNSLDDKLKQRINMAEFGYYYAKYEDTLKEQQDKFGNGITNGVSGIYNPSLEDLDQQVTAMFWKRQNRKGVEK